MITSNKALAKPACSDFLLDIVANRLSWISKSDLIELASKAGYLESNTNAQIRRCQKARLLFRGSRNVFNRNAFGCWFEPNKSDQQAVAIRRFVHSESLSHRSIASPTELISIGALAAGLLGVPQPVEPELELLASWMRLYTAFMHHIHCGFEPTNWRKLGRQHFLSGLAAIAVVSTRNSSSKKLVAAPVAMTSAKIESLHRSTQQFEGAV